MSHTPAPGTLRVSGVTRGLSGQVVVPGDKSISHRAAMLGAIADGTTCISNFLPATDCLATLEAVRGLGVQVDFSDYSVSVHGKGLRGLQEPDKVLDCGGSGTTMRLLAGLLAGQPLYSVLTGNAQLSRRPMDRVAVPLRQMGATILGRAQGKYPPLSIAGGNLKGITFEMPVASAQVKSALLLAGLFADGPTSVIEPAPSRDHTERMLVAMGASVRAGGGVVTIEPPGSLQSLNIDVTGDLSSAAFMLAAAAIVPDSRLVVTGVGVNPGRLGFLNALHRMGANLTLRNERTHNGEPVADIEIAHRQLTSVEIAPGDVPGMIDELPLLAVVATQAEGVTEVRGAAELRVKETDRITTTATELTRLGARIEPLPDGFRVIGPTRLRANQVSSHGDHRLAMSLAIAALVAEGETVIGDTSCIDDSFPGFQQALKSVLEGERE